MEKLREFLERVDSSLPTPGGGAVAAYSSSLAVALARMALNISIKRKSFNNYSKEDQTHLLSLNEELLELENKMYEMKGKDEETFNEYMIAFRSKDEKAILDMTIKCFYQPYKLNELILKVLDIIFEVEKYVVSSVMSDYKMSLIMLESMIECCNENMLINLNYLDNEEILDIYNEINDANQEYLKRIENKKESWR